LSPGFAAFHLQIQFTGLLGASTIFDVIWMIQNSQSGFIKFLTVVLTLLKVVGKHFVQTSNI